MKRTYGKIKSRKRAQRFNILNEDGHCVAQKVCSTTSQALREFFSQQLRPQGYTDPVVIGNTLSVMGPKQHGTDYHNYTAATPVPPAR